MPWKKKYRERKSLRLKGWDYRTPGWYFIIMVTKNRQHFFGEIRDNIIGLSTIGGKAYQNWTAITDHFDHVALGEFVIMPNHIHGLIGIMNWPVKKENESERKISQRSPFGTCHGMSQSSIQTKFGNPKSGSISTIINHFKGSVTRSARKSENYKFGWQSRFHDHIVRNNRSLDHIRQYIHNNLLQWKSDQLYEVE